jgi:hypothetical protein
MDSEFYKEMYSLGSIDFFNFLRRIITETTNTDMYRVMYVPGLVRQIHHYEMISFRTEICEYIFNGIKMFPDIDEYTISCRNEEPGEKKLVISYKSELEDDSISVIITPNDKYALNKADIYELFIFNKIVSGNHIKVNALVMLLYGTGRRVPKISTSFKINKERAKNCSKK